MAYGLSSMDSSSWLAMWEPAAIHYREETFGKFLLEIGMLPNYTAIEFQYV